MIEKIIINALKSVDNLSLKCKKLNVIAGANSSGKSTVLQSILIASQNTSILSGLNGRFVSLGEFKEAKNFHTASRKIEISLLFSGDKSFSLEIDEEGVEPTPAWNPKFSKEFRALSDIKYLSCNRIGVEDIYKKQFSKTRDVGINGQFAVDCLERHKSENVSKELIKDQTSYTLFSQVNYWLNYILGTSISTEDITGTDYVKCFYTTKEGMQIRPKNTGAGISYLISVLVMCLMSQPNEILVIENPEIHLHPTAQSKVCEFLYFISSTGRQLFVETHSDHIFNGIRVGIATSQMDSNDIAINFFVIDEKTNCTRNHVIEFGKRGRILNCVDGLFDQFDIDLNRMLDI